MNRQVRRCVVASCSVALLAGACSGSDEASPDASSGVTMPASDGARDDDGDPFTRSTDEMRAVPTVAPPTVAGQSGDDDDADDGVIEVSPTLSPPPPDAVDPDAPATTASPPTTELVGDPQPSPDTTQPPPPATVAPPPDACTRLADFDVARIVADEGGSPATVTLIDDASCRFESGSVRAEVFFIPIDEVRDDWYRRDGIEPVAEAGGEAVGFGTYVTPSGATGEGYTIAIAGGRDGVVVAVSGTSDARLVAADVTVFANQAA